MGYTGVLARCSTCMQALYMWCLQKRHMHVRQIASTYPRNFGTQGTCNTQHHRGNLYGHDTCLSVLNSYSIHTRARAHTHTCRLFTHACWLIFLRWVDSCMNQYVEAVATFASVKRLKGLLVVRCLAVRQVAFVRLAVRAQPMAPARARARCSLNLRNKAHSVCVCVCLCVCVCVCAERQTCARRPAVCVYEGARHVYDRPGCCGWGGSAATRAGRPAMAACAQQTWAQTAGNRGQLFWCKREGHQYDGWTQLICLLQRQCRHLANDVHHALLWLGCAICLGGQRRRKR